MAENALTKLSLSIQDLSAQLATELAAGLSSEETLKQRYELSDEAWEMLQQNPVFIAMKQEAVKTLTGDINAKNRIRLKASVAFEDTIPNIYKMAHDPKIPANARLEAAKILSRVSGVDSQVEGTVAANGFSININLGESREPITISGRNSNFSSVDNYEITSMPQH